MSTEERCESYRGFWLYTWAAYLYRGRPPVWCYSVEEMDGTEIDTNTYFPTRQIALDQGMASIDGTVIGRRIASKPIAATVPDQAEESER